LPSELFVTRAPVIEQICARLRQPELLSTVVVGGPRTGKTSLLRFLASGCADKCLAERAAVIRVYVDAAPLGERSTPFDFWTRTFRELRRTLDDRPAGAPFVPAVERGEQAARQQTLDVFDIEDVFDTFARASLPVVLLIDDFHVLAANQHFASQDFFNVLRSMWQRVPHGLATVAASMRPLHEIAPRSSGPSPFYNVTATQMLGRLSAEEIREVVAALFRSGKVALPESAIAQIARASAGHPLLVHYIAAVAAAAVEDGHAFTDLELGQAIADPNGPFTGLTASILSVLGPSERRAVETLMGGGTLTASQSDLLKRLDAYGLVPVGFAV
jgi:hypothetical protein